MRYLTIAIAVQAIVSGVAHGQPGEGQQSNPSNVTVQYQSDIPGSGYEWLESQQRLAYGDQGAAPMTVEQLLAVLRALPPRAGWEDSDSIMRAVRIGELKLPTRYEDIGGYFIVNALAQEIRAVAEQESGQRLPNLIWGTLPLPEINASAQKYGEDQVVIVHTRLFAFLYAALLLVDRTISIEDTSLGFGERAFGNALRESPDLVADFTDLIVAFGKSGELPNLRFADNREAVFVSRQLESIERFIVGHEFGHILHGHTTNGVRVLAVPRAGGGSFELLSFGRDWHQELEADFAGLRLAGEAYSSPW